jgi:hypothetical protein
VILRKLHPGNSRLVPDADGGLWAEYDLAPRALLLKEGHVVAGGGFVRFRQASLRPAA